jgi:hypothetical protein
MTDNCTRKTVRRMDLPDKMLSATGIYNASPGKELFFWRIFCSAKNAGLSGVPPRRMTCGPAPWPMVTCGGPAPPEVNPQRL